MTGKPQNANHSAELNVFRGVDRIPSTQDFWLHKHVVGKVGDLNAKETTQRRPPMRSLDDSTFADFMTSHGSVFKEKPSTM